MTLFVGMNSSINVGEWNDVSPYCDVTLISKAPLQSLNMNMKKSEFHDGIPPMLEKKVMLVALGLFQASRMSQECPSYSPENTSHQPVKGKASGGNAKTLTESYACQIQQQP